MANDAEKKNISRLDFNINDAINSLDLVNQKLETISKSSEVYAQKIGKNLKSSLDLGSLLNAESISKELSKVTNISESDAKKMVARIMNQEIMVTANAKKEAEKRRTIKLKATADVYKSEVSTADKIKVIEANTSSYREKRAADAALAHEKANIKIANSTKTMYDKIYEYAKTYVIYQGFNQLKNAAIESVEAMKAVEYRMMEISRIMEDGSIVVDKYRDSLIELAYQYGRSFEDVSTITLNFARAGYDAQDAIAMTEQSLLALNTAELDAEQSTEGLISILAQWDMNTGTTAEKSQNLANVIDKINKTADNFPISSEGLLDALKRTSQGFNLAGATIDETIAMIVAAETASQRGGKVIGTAMANMQQQLKAEGKLDLAEAMGLDLFEDEAKTQFKSITEIFALMSERMKELEDAGKGSSTEMQSLLELFTVFRRNIGAGLLSEMSGEDSSYLKALETSLNSAGYSAQENAKYMGTMEAATQQLNATILQLQSTLYDEGGKSIFTSLILGAESGVNAINSLIQTFGIFPTTIATATLAFGLFNKNMNYDGIKRFINKLTEANAALKLYNQTMKTGEVNAKEFNDIMGNDISKNMQKYIAGLDGAEASMGRYIAKTIAAKAGQIALNIAIAAGEAAISFGLSLAIQAIVGVISDWVNATKNASAAIQTMNDNLESSVSEIGTYSSKFQTLRNEMQNSTLTQEEYNVKKKELINLQQELIDKFGEEAKGIDLVTGEINKQKEAIEALSKANYNKYIQENQKELNKVIKKVTKNASEWIKFDPGFFKGFSDGFVKDINKISEELQGRTYLDTTWTDNQLYLYPKEGTAEEIIEYYRNLFEKVKDYRNEAVGENQELADDLLEKISSTIKKLEEEYGEDIKNYKEFLNNKLKYDEFYSSVYGQILEARANLEKAILSGDDAQIEEAQNKLNSVYKGAIERAKKDPEVSGGMVELLEEQINQLNNTTDREQIKIKLGVEEKTLFNSIQGAIDSMGEISLEDLQEGLNAENLTEGMAALKAILDANGISVQDLINNFDYFGFTIGGVRQKVENAKDTLKYLTEQSEDSINALAALDSGFVSVYSAMDEFNQKGYISGTTLQNLINNDLLQYFEVVNGKLAINEAAMANAATAAKAKAIEDLQAKAAAEIAAIAFDEEGTAAGTAEGTTKGMTEKTKEVKNALIQMTPEVLKGADAWGKFNAAMGGSMEGLSEDQTKKIQGILNNLSKSITAINSLKIENVSYRRVTAQSSEGSSAKRDAERAAEEAKKAEEEAYKARLAQFTDFIKERERLEKRWVDKQKELGMLSNKDYMYITQQRIERYKKYLEEVRKATWMNAEDRLELEKEYSEKIEDLQVDYIGYLEDQLKDEIKALEDANEEKIKLIKEEADARIAALDKVTEATDRARAKEDYENERQSILEEISYWEQRTGREAQEALKEAKKKLAELDAEWEDTQEDWSIEDQIKQIEEERDAEIAAIEAAQEAEIKAMQEVYDAKVKMFVETGEIIYEGSVIQAQSLYNAYKANFIDPISAELANLNKATTNTAAPTQQQQQQYETYTIKAGDTLSKIARSFGTTVDKIMAANPYITNKNRIYAGKTLQIPKFHEGGIVGGNQEAFALLKPHEVILKPEWAEGINKLAKMAKANEGPISNSTVVEVKGDLVRIDAKINDKTDAEYLTRRIEKMLKDKFNIKK